MAEFPVLPFWTDAYIADTQHLTNEEHGVYLRLLMFAWRTQECGLPDDDRRLALMVGVTAKKWSALKPIVMKFWTLNEGLWTQKKLTSGRENVERNREQKRAAGIASSEAKALKKQELAPTAVSEPLVTADPTAHPTAEVQSLTLSKEEDISRKTGLRKRTKSDDIQALEMEFSEAFWPVYPRKVDRKDALQAFVKARKKVSLETIMGALHAFVRENSGTEKQFIRHAARWLNAEGWDNGQGHSSGAIPTGVDLWRKRLRLARSQNVWSTREWGPRPGAGGCCVPPELIKPDDGTNWREREVAA